MLSFLFLMFHINRNDSPKFLELETQRNLFFLVLHLYDSGSWKYDSENDKMKLAF